MGALGVILVMSQSASYVGHQLSAQSYCVFADKWENLVSTLQLCSQPEQGGFWCSTFCAKILSSKPATSKTSAHQSGNDIFLLEHLKYYPHLASGKECRLKVLHLSQPEATWMYLLIQQVGGNTWLYMIYKEPKHKQAHWKCQT